MTDDPIARIPLGSYGLLCGAPGGPAELWTRWEDDDGQPRLTLRTSGIGGTQRHPAAARAAAAIRIVENITAARGCYTFAAGRCSYCSTTALGSRRDWQLGACPTCAETRHPAELGAVAAAARRAWEHDHAAA